MKLNVNTIELYVLLMRLRKDLLPMSQIIAHLAVKRLSTWTEIQIEITHKCLE